MNTIKVERTIKKNVVGACFKGKVVVIYGPRRVGKTTLAKEIINDFGGGLYMTCDDPLTRQELSDKNTDQLLGLIRGHKVVVIDEAQRITNIGLVLKQIIDAVSPEVQIIATGSSSFDLANKINEPLTGRSSEFLLYPFSIEELQSFQNSLELKSTLNDRILYGMYPEIVLGLEDRKKTLFNLSEQYLYKDLLSYGGIRKPELLEKILKVLASSAGQLISYTEISNTLDISKDTVESYVRILEQAFIIYVVTPYSKNVRSELTKKRKIFFIDTGILNMISQDLTPFDVKLRNNKGNIWENFVFTERIKFTKNNDKFLTKYNFWRTTEGQEIDIIETEGLQMRAFEVKWNMYDAKPIPEKFKIGYPDARFDKITIDNFLDIINSV